MTRLRSCELRRDKGKQTLLIIPTHILFIRRLTDLNRKEVIHEQLPLPMPCYDFFPVTEPTVVPWLNMDLRVFPAPLKWRAVSAKFENVFTAACWSAITSDSGFMEASCSLQSELGVYLMGLAPPRGLATHCFTHCIMCVAQDIRGPRWLDVIPTFLPVNPGSLAWHV